MGGITGVSSSSNLTSCEPEGTIGRRITGETARKWHLSATVDAVIAFPAFQRDHHDGGARRVTYAGSITRALFPPPVGMMTTIGLRPCWIALIAGPCIPRNPTRGSRIMSRSWSRGTCCDNGPWSGVGLRYSGHRPPKATGGDPRLQDRLMTTLLGSHIHDCGCNLWGQDEVRNIM
jgi:hypothetical protein